MPRELRFEPLEERTPLDAQGLDALVFSVPAETSSRLVDVQVGREALSAQALFSSASFPAAGVQGLPPNADSDFGRVLTAERDQARLDAWLGYFRGLDGGRVQLEAGRFAPETWDALLELRPTNSIAANGSTRLGFEGFAEADGKVVYFKFALETQAAEGEASPQDLLPSFSFEDLFPTQEIETQPPVPHGPLPLNFEPAPQEFIGPLPLAQSPDYDMFPAGGGGGSPVEDDEPPAPEDTRKIPDENELKPEDEPKGAEEAENGLPEGDDKSEEEEPAAKMLPNEGGAEKSEEGVLNQEEEPRGAADPRVQGEASPKTSQPQEKPQAPPAAEHGAPMPENAKPSEQSRLDAVDAFFAELGAGTETLDPEPAAAGSRAAQVEQTGFEERAPWRLYQSDQESPVVTPGGDMLPASAAVALASQPATAAPIAASVRPSSWWRRGAQLIGRALGLAA
jgi:hypothetical protein